MVWQPEKNTVKDLTESKRQLWQNGWMFWECIRNGKGTRNKNNEQKNNRATSPASSTRQTLMHSCTTH